MIKQSLPTEARSSEWEDDEIDLRELILKIWRGRWVVTSAVLLCAFISAAVAFRTTPVYQATTVLAPANTGKSGGGGLSAALGQFGGLAALAGINVGSGDSDVQEALAVLSSREFTERFINEKNLMPTLYPKLWDANKNEWKVSEVKRPTLAKAAAYFGKIRTVTQDNKTGLITLSIAWRDRHEAADWANELVRRVNEEMRTRAIAKAGASLGYLDQELKRNAQIGIQEAINRLIEMQINQRMLANVTAEYSFRVVDKALPADEDDPIKPKKVLIIFIGLISGAFLGVLWVFLAGALRRDGQGASATPQDIGS